jgi:hypothetical protein
VVVSTGVEVGMEPNFNYLPTELVMDERMQYVLVLYLGG